MNAIRQFVTVQPGGRVEVFSSDLPVGGRAEVIVLVGDPPAEKRLEFLGMFADAPELIDSIVQEAMSAREHPLRASDE